MTAAENAVQKSGKHSTVIEMIEKVEQATQVVNALPDGAALYHELIETAQKLRNQQQMIAVFGAFSAGKSSLLNAIVGESLLTVSPNPTTAAVTHILDNRQFAGETAQVYAKTVTQLWDDVRHAYQSLHIEVADVESAVVRATTLRMADYPAAARKSVSFITSVATGWQEMGPRLGTSWLIEGDDIRRYTADEKFACFIHRVDIARESLHLEEQVKAKLGQSLAELPPGLVFVDTPGVDSIHRRHTDVAFDYMRQADVILFVLYYTHALSRADADFLQQLSGVQDVTGLNKLFVVINAVDLAKSEEEKKEVTNRVTDELKRLGIRQPRVYEVSSQLGFAAKQSATQADLQWEGLVRHRLNLSQEAPLPSSEQLYRLSGLHVLETDLTDYILTENESLARDAAMRSLQHVLIQVDRRIQQGELTLVSDAEMHFLQTQRGLAVLNDIRGQITPWMEGSVSEFTRMNHDFAELVFHIGERIRLKFPALFREAFHPGRFRLGKDMHKELRAGSVELTRMLERQIEIEVRTFGLRAASFVSTVGHQLQLRILDAVTSLHPLVTEALEVQMDTSFADVSVRGTLVEEPIEGGFRYFSSPKQFFEQGGQTEMLQSVTDASLHQVRAQVTVLCNQVTVNAWKALQTGIVKMLSQAANDVESYLENAHAELSSLELEQLKNVSQQLATLLLPHV